MDYHFNMSNLGLRANIRCAVESLDLEDLGKIVASTETRLAGKNRLQRHIYWMLPGRNFQYDLATKLLRKRFQSKINDLENTLLQAGPHLSGADIKNLSKLKKLYQKELLFDLAGKFIFLSNGHFISAADTEEGLYDIVPEELREKIAETACIDQVGVLLYKNST